MQDRPLWTAAFALTLLLSAASAATGPAPSEAPIDPVAGSAAVADDAEIVFAAPASPPVAPAPVGTGVFERTLPDLSPAPYGGNGTSPTNGTNNTNQTPPQNETPADKAPDLSPDNRSFVIPAWSTLTFNLTLTNPASTTQNVSLRAEPSSLEWHIQLSRGYVVLAPGASTLVEVYIHSQTPLPSQRTFAIHASGSGGNDTAYAHVCARGPLGYGCGPVPQGGSPAALPGDPGEARPIAAASVGLRVEAEGSAGGDLVRVRSSLGHLAQVDL